MKRGCSKQRKQKCIDPEMGMCLENLGNRKEAGIARRQGKEVREVA
jgi:hypothetical protein